MRRGEAAGAGGANLRVVGDWEDALVEHLLQKCHVLSKAKSMEMCYSNKGERASATLRLSMFLSVTSPKSTLQRNEGGERVEATHGGCGCT